MSIVHRRDRRRSAPAVEGMEARTLLSTAAGRPADVVRADADDCVPVGLSAPLPNPLPSPGILNLLDRTRNQADGRYGGTRSNSKGYHQGLDIAAIVGVPVLSVMSGVILPSKQGGLDGNKVRVRNDDGTISVYSHLGAGGLARRKPGGDFANRVVAGQVIGRVGRSGNVPPKAGTHLHFQMFSATGEEIVPNIRPIAPQTLLAPGFCIAGEHTAPDPTPSPVPGPGPEPDPGPAPTSSVYKMSGSGSFSDGPFAGSAGFPSTVTVAPGQDPADAFTSAFTDFFSAEADKLRAQLRPGESLAAGPRTVTISNLTSANGVVRGSYSCQGGSGVTAYSYGGSFTATLSG